MLACLAQAGRDDQLSAPTSCRDTSVGQLLDHADGQPADREWGSRPGGAQAAYQRPIGYRADVRGAPDRAAILDRVLRCPSRQSRRRT